jgi:2',3'-cyclic-nucleotide 2'-phosphodiesterase (5'-nucleotidase family)
MRRALPALLLLLLAACAPAKEELRPTPAAAIASAPGAPTAPRRTLRLVLTTDEHGWLEPLVDEASQRQLGGMLAFAARLEEERRGRSDVALLSAGDMWTGPYESTVLEGIPMVKSMNHLGYLAAAVGNHEFDFGVKTLAKRQSEARFPLLGANIVEAGQDTSPPWAQRSVLLEVGGINLGVVGLSTEDTPMVTDPRHVVGLEFRGYEETLRGEVPRLRAAGAEQIIVLLHDRVSTAARMAGLLRELGVHAVAAGHAHASEVLIDTGTTPDDVSDDIVICNGGAYLRSYCRIDFAFVGNRLVERSAHIEAVERGIAEAVSREDPLLVQIIDDARARSEASGREVLATAAAPISRHSGALGQLVVDSWLDALPYVDVAITNAGGLRQDISKGPVRMRDVVGALPFNNSLLVLELTGEQLSEALENPESVAGGVRFTYSSEQGQRRLLELSRADGRRIGPRERLKVVVNDFMYRGGDRYHLKRHDPKPEETAIDWREPLLFRLRSLGQEEKALTIVVDDRAREIK